MDPRTLRSAAHAALLALPAIVVGLGFDADVVPALLVPSALLAASAAVHLAAPSLPRPAADLLHIGAATVAIAGAGIASIPAAFLALAALVALLWSPANALLAALAAVAIAVPTGLLAADAAGHAAALGESRAPPLAAVDPVARMAHELASQADADRRRPARLLLDRYLVLARAAEQLERGASRLAAPDEVAILGEAKASLADERRRVRAAIVRLYAAEAVAPVRAESDALLAAEAALEVEALPYADAAPGRIAAALLARRCRAAS